MEGAAVATVIQWTGLEARALRETLRMSMREFARRTNLSPSTIADNEAKGEQAQLRRATQAILDRVLEQAPADAHARFEVLLEGMAASANRLVGSLERSEDPTPTNGAQSAATRAGDPLEGVAIPSGSGVEDVRRRALVSRCRMRPPRRSSAVGNASGPQPCTGRST
jgi:transcriptional regulator with XRE-family HTH domain